MKKNKTILRIEPCKADGKIYYMIKHYNRLKPNGMLADSGYSLFMTYEKAKESFNEL